MPKLAPTEAGPFEAPYDALGKRLDPYMWVSRFDLLSQGVRPVRLAHPAKLSPWGLDIDGILKPGRGMSDDQAQRQHYHDVFEQILGLFTELGLKHQSHPEFEIGGHVVRQQFQPDRLIPECKVRFKLLLGAIDA